MFWYVLVCFGMFWHVLVCNYIDDNLALDRLPMAFISVMDIRYKKTYDYKTHCTIQ